MNLRTWPSCFSVFRSIRRRPTGRPLRICSRSLGRSREGPVRMWTGQRRYERKVIMALIFCDSVDHYDSGDILSKWDASNGFTVSASGGRCNTAGFVYDGAGAAGVKKNVASAATYILSFAHFIPAIGTGDTIIA